MINPMELSGRTILVTGASSGIGRETAIVLSQLGPRLILVGRNTERLNATLAALEGDLHRAETFDLTAVDEIPQWIKRITAECGPLDGIVHSAGIQKMTPARFFKKDDLDAMMNINVGAAFGLVRGLRQRGCHKPDSRVVLISSIMGLVGQTGIGGYSATKGALIALGRSLALELAGDGIRVNCIAPGVVETEMLQEVRQTLNPDQVAQIKAMHPLGLGSPTDVAYGVAYLLSEAGRWITGSTLVIDGGYTIH